jgi:hypothetical protein
MMFQLWAKSILICLLTQLALDSHARTSALQALEQVWQESEAVFIGKSGDSLSSLSQDGSFWKTSQTFLLEEEPRLQQALPPWGMTQDGQLYPLQPLALFTKGSAGFSLPTVIASDWKPRGPNSKQKGVREVLVGHLTLPTPTASEHYGSGRKRFVGSPHYRGAKTSEALRTCFSDPIYLNPSFAEMMMGFPIGWTDLRPWVIPFAHNKEG